MRIRHKAPGYLLNVRHAMKFITSAYLRALYDQASIPDSMPNMPNNLTVIQFLQNIDTYSCRAVPIDIKHVLIADLA